VIVLDGGICFMAFRVVAVGLVDEVGEDAGLLLK